MHFLDKFVYRNAKKSVTTKGHSIMQPLSGSRRDGGVVFTKGNHQHMPLNTEKFLQLKEQDVDADELFFHKYFNQKAVNTTKKAKKDKSSEDDEEDEVWRAMMSSIPGGLEDEDEDEGLDLDEEDDEEDDEAMRALLMSDEEDNDVGEDVAEFGSDEEEEMDGEDDLEFMNASDMSEEESSKRPADEESDQPKKKKQKKERLPTFASYEDYAKLIEKDLANDEDTEFY